MIDLSTFGAETLFGKLARMPLRILPRSSSVPILQGPLRGAKWIVGSQRHAFWLGSYEPALQALMAKTVKRGSIFYDIGANVGFYSLLASRLVGDGKVYAFEPLPRNTVFLRQHLALNTVRNVDVIEMAVSDQVGTARFAVEATGAMGHIEESGTLQVPSTTLDALTEQRRIAPPDYIKMDIEGEEGKALRGAERCLRSSRPTLLLATHGAEIRRDCCSLLHSWNFATTVIDQQSEDRAEFLAVPVR